MYIYGAVAYHYVLIPNPVEYLLPGKYFLWFGDQQGEQFKLFSWKGDVFSLFHHQVPLFIDKGDKITVNTETGKYLRRV